jgi:uncharacterized protein YndB with AHSA1/START domain
MTSSATTSPAADTRTVQVYAVYIKSSPQQIWDAITEPEWNRRFGYAAPSEFDLRPGGTFRSTPSDAMRVAGEQMGFPTPDVILDGEVIESDPPRKLVQTWRLLMDPACAAEPFSTLTYEIGAADHNGVCRLTVSHDLSGAPATARLVAGHLEETGAGGGWNWVLDDLKTMLETGHAFGE